MTKPIVCVVLPTYNEAKNVQTIIPKILEQHSKLVDYTLHVLVVDSDSPDGTMGNVQQLQQSYSNLHAITESERGLGVAYITGFNYAIDTINAELVFEMDADGQHDPTLIPLFVQMIDAGFDCIIGSRFVSGSQLVNFSFKRTFISKLGNWLIRVVGGIPKILDCTSGYRCIKVDFIKQCRFDRLLVGGYSFQSSLLSELVVQNAQIMEFPIVFSERMSGESKLRFMDQITFLFNLLFIRLNQSKLFIRYVLIGCSGVGVNLGMYLILTRLLLMPIDTAFLVAIEISVVTNFIGHHWWTFRRVHLESKPIIRRFWEYHVSVLLSLAVNAAVFFILVKWAMLWDVAANVIGIGAGFLVNYRMNSRVSWKQR